MKNDPIIKVLIAYLQREKEFLGTASELVELLQLQIRSNVLSKRLNQYEHELKKIGIEFIKMRTGERREILLTYTPPDAFMTV